MDARAVYIIAEIGPNHNGDVNIALNMVDRLAKIGVDAIKFQMANPDLLYSGDAFQATYQKRNDKVQDVKTMSLSHRLMPEDYRRLYSRCKELGIDFICTAFDMESLLFLDTNFDMPYYKIASGEIFSLDLIDYMAHKDKSIILSTGMATYEEVELAINFLNKHEKKDITILHCISNYPAAYNEVNLNNMLALKDRFHYEVGFSDHTKGCECAIAAVAMGAVMIEKHVTFDINAPGPDHKASITIEEFGTLVQQIRHIEKAKGSYEREFSLAQREITSVARKSIVTKRRLAKGDVITLDDICFKRPGIGFLPIEIDKVIGKKIICDLAADRVIRKEYLDA